MTKQNITGIIIILAILIGYSIYMTPSEEERLEAQRKQDSIAEARRAFELEADTLDKDTIGMQQAEAVARKVADDKADIIEETDSDYNNQLRDRLGVFAENAKGEEKLYTIENEYLILEINSKGGFIHSAELKDYKTWEQNPLLLFHDEFNDFRLNFYYANRIINTSELYFEAFSPNRDIPDDKHLKVEKNDSLEFAMRIYVEGHEENNPKYLEFYYVLQGKNHMLDIDLRFVGLENILGIAPRLEMGWDIKSPRQEKSFVNDQRNSTIYYEYLNDGVSYLSETRDASERLGNRVKWISFKQQFFSIVLIAQNHFTSADIKTEMIDEEEDPYFTKHMSMLIDVDYDMRSDESFPMSLYLGPNHYQTLTSYNLNLERQIPLGWSFFLMSWINRFLVIPVFNWLDTMNLGYGLIILLLTLMLKVILLPIAYKTYISSAKMRVLKPEIEELGKKFPKKEDSMKKQQATMALYKKAGVNPMAGCVPMLLQLPILLSLFRFFPSSIELRQEGFLWADDLSSYDSILDLPFTIPMYGDHVSLFTLLMAVSTIIYTKMNSQMMSTGNQMPGMKMMLYFMPVMLVFIFNSFASGLSYYYFLSNVITFGQMYLFRFFINEDALRAKIEENKKKPVKQSKWQQRMQKLAQEKQAAQKRKK